MFARNVTQICWFGLWEKQLILFSIQWLYLMRIFKRLKNYVSQRAYFFHPNSLSQIDEHILLSLCSRFWKGLRYRLSVNWPKSEGNFSRATEVDGKNSATKIIGYIRLYKKSATEPRPQSFWLFGFCSFLSLDVKWCVNSQPLKGLWTIPLPCCFPHLHNTRLGVHKNVYLERNCKEANISVLSI